MEIVIIPGFLGHPQEVTFKKLTETLIQKGHSVSIISWPNFPNNLDKYNFTETLISARHALKDIDPTRLILLGFSMGGIIATYLASEFNPKRLGLIITPYQAGTEDDLSGKYKDWKETGYRNVTSSVYGDLVIPFSFIEDAQKYNAIDKIKEVKCPKLFIVGEIDKNVPWQTTKKLYELADEPKEWHLIPNMEHRYQYQPEEQGMVDKVNKIILSFIEK